MNEDFKNEVKRKWRIMSKRLLRVAIVITVIVIMILPAAVYKVKLDDGTYDEGDWGNTQYAAGQYTGGTNIGSDGKITTNMTAQELWDKMMDEGSRVDLYLDKPEELLKLMNAQMVTQYLDTRSNPDDPIDWDAITDINSNEVQGIIKLKRAQADGTIKTMTYVDPETFQTYVDNYNASGSESDRNTALSHFTLERTTIANNSGTARPIEAGETINIPAGLGAVHTYMGWQMITSTTSTQYQLREQAGMNFDEEGFGKINGRYVIACTTTYGQVGDYIDFYQADGSIIPCIIGDIKNQNDAGCNEWGHLDGTCIIEFVVDKTTWYNPMHENPGNPNCHPEWNQYLTKAVNGGSYFDNPDFGAEDITPNKDSHSSSGSESSESELCWPTDGTNITSQFGLRDSPTAGASSDHRGIDIGVSTGTNVYACEAGTVTTAGWSDSAGNWVVIDHGNGYVTKYMHNSEVLVSAGDTVKKGQTIAKSGSTGISTGPHLHFQIEYNGQAVDPLSFKYNNGMGNGTGGIGSSTGGSSSSTTTTYYAKVATWNQVTDTVESNDPDVESYSTTTYNMTTTRINYQEFVSGYTMPFDYLWDLLVISEDKDFVLDLADLVHDSEIEITVHDNLSINTNVNTYTYTENEKIISRGVRIAGNSEEQGGRVRVGYPGASDPHINSVDRTVIHTIVTTTNTLDISLTKANVWIVNYTKEYTYEVPENIVTEGGAGALEDIPYTDEPDHTTQTDDIGYGASQRQSYQSQWVQEIPDIVATLEQVYCDYYYSTTNRNESITNTLERTTYVEPPKANIEEKTDKHATEPNFVTLLLKEGNRRAKHHILGTSSWLFDLLLRNDSTADMVDLTKYLLYKASGNTKYWDPDQPFDFSIFDPESFVSIDSDYGDWDGTGSQEDFIRAVAPYAVIDMQQHKIYASVTIAQAIIESGWGKDNIAIQYKNFFGMKGGGAGPNEYWSGEVVNLNASEGGVSGFRVYDSLKNSVYDHGRNFHVTSTYAAHGVLDCIPQNLGPKEQLRRIAISGYAVYQDGSISRPDGVRTYDVYLYEEFIQKYNLEQYDSMTPEDFEQVGGNSEIVEIAKSKLGCPYVWGATGPDSFDCSGLVQWTYAQAGISVPRTTYDYVPYLGTSKEVSWSEAQPGDIVWRNEHMGIYLGNDQYIHAPHTGDVVKISSGAQGAFTNVFRFTN